MKIDSSLRPFEKKSFFLDLNGFPQEASLIKNLKLLGARHEPVFSKYVSFVVSNKVPLKTTPATWNQSPYSPLTPKSNGMCPSPLLLSDCPMDYLDSSVYAISPNTDQNAPSPVVQSRGMALLKKATADKNPPPPMVQSRGMALLKQATKKVKENHRATDLLEHCKRWGIKVYHVDKILSKVKKCTNLIAAEYAKKKDLKKKNSKKNNECSSDVKKLLPPFLKFEDSNRKFKPIFQEFTSWTDVIDSSLSRNINQISKQFKRTGDVSDVARSVFAEININVDSNLPKIHSPRANDSNTKSFSHTKLTETLKPSNSTSVQVSTVIHPIDRENKNTIQLAKNKKYRKRARTLYCEICHKNYINLDEHMNTEKHKKFMSNPMNFLVVQDVVTSLPKKGDHLLLNSFMNYESNMSFPASFFVDTGIIPYDNTVSRSEMIDTNYDPGFNINDLPTEPYSFLDPEVVSPSCSSPDIGPLPFLEDSLEKPLLYKGETGENSLYFNREKKPDINQDIPLDFNILQSQNASLNLTENCISNDVSGLPLSNGFISTDFMNTLIEGSKCQEETGLGNQISVTDAPKNVFAENCSQTESGSYNNAESRLCAEPVVVFPNSNQNKLPEESVLNVPVKENCDSDSISKDKTNDIMELLQETKPDIANAQVAFNSVDVNIHAKRKKRKQTGTENSDFVSKKKRRKVKSQKKNGSIKKIKRKISVHSCNSIHSVCNNVSSVQNNLFTQSLLFSKIGSSSSDGTCDSQDSAIVVHLNDSLQNNENMSKSVSEAFEICSEIAQTFEKFSSDCTGKKVNMDSDPKSLSPSPFEINAEETDDSQDSAIVVPLNDIDSTALATLNNSPEYIPESVSEVLHICCQTAMAFETVNPKDCMKRRSIESCTSDSDDLNYPLCPEVFPDSAVDSGICVPPPYFMHFTLNSSFEKCAEEEAELSLNLDTNCSSVMSGSSYVNYDAAGMDLSVQKMDGGCLDENKTKSLKNLDNCCCLDISVSSCISANSYSSTNDFPLESKDTSMHTEEETTHICQSEVNTSVNFIQEETQTESSINSGKTCCFDVSVNNCTSANGYSSTIEYPLESKDTSMQPEEESSYICQSEVNTSVNFVHEDTSLIELHSMDDSESEMEATHTTIYPEQDKPPVLEPVTYDCSGDLLYDNLSIMPVISLHNEQSFVYNNHPNSYRVSENEDNGQINFVKENKECSLEILPKINDLVCTNVSGGDQLLSVAKTKNLESIFTDLTKKKNKSAKCTVGKHIHYTFISTSLTGSKHFSFITGNKLQLLHISGIRFQDCLFICNLSHCLAGSGEIFAAETPKLQECLISVDSTIKISSVKQKQACHLADVLKSYSNTGRWNLLLVKMEDLKLESGFIGLILEKCQGKALITLSSMGNKSSVSTNCTLSPKPNSPVFVTILFPYQDSTVNDNNGIKNDWMIGKSVDNSFAEICGKSLVVSQPLNLCTKESEQMGTTPLQTSTIFPQLNSYLNGTVGNLASYSSFDSRFEFSSSDFCSYEIIAEQLNHASSNLQYIEPISVCTFECEVSCCKPCTCDLGGGKCLPQTCNKFHYFETSSMDSSDNELASTNQSLLNFWSKPILEVNNLAPNNINEISSTSDVIGGTYLPQICDNFQFSEANSMGSSDNGWFVPNELETPGLNLSNFSEINNYGSLCDGDTNDTSPLSPVYIVIDDADFESDEEWDTVKSEVNNLS